MLNSLLKEVSAIIVCFGLPVVISFFKHNGWAQSLAIFVLLPLLLCSFFIELYENIKNRKKYPDKYSIKSVFFSWKVFWIIFLACLFLREIIYLPLLIYTLIWILTLKNNEPKKKKHLYTSKDIINGFHGTMTTMSNKKTSVVTVCVYIFLFVLVVSLFGIDAAAPETTLILILPFLVAIFLLLPLLLCSFFIKLYKNIKNRKKYPDKYSIKSVLFSWKVFWIIFLAFLLLGKVTDLIFFWYIIPVVLLIYGLVWIGSKKSRKKKHLYTSKDIINGKHL